MLAVIAAVVVLAASARRPLETSVNCAALPAVVASPAPLAYSSKALPVRLIVPVSVVGAAAPTESVDNALARSPTDPHVAIPEPMIPRTSTEKRPALQRPPGPPTPERARSPMPSDLIVPNAARAEADAQIDEVFADLTQDHDKPRASKPRIVPEVDDAPADDEVGAEITIEAEPPPMPTYAPPRPSTRHTRPTVRIDDDEPEISIERLVEIEVDAPMMEPDSSPEIVVIHGNRPITANDTKHVAGTIETPKRSS